MGITGRVTKQINAVTLGVSSSRHSTNTLGLKKVNKCKYDSIVSANYCLMTSILLYMYECIIMYIVIVVQLNC